jgi:hypothetical protein
MGGIIASVTGHLRDGATRTPIRTTAILAPMTLLLGNLILLSNVSASFANNDYKENGECHNHKVEKEDHECTCCIGLSVFDFIV